MINILKAKIRRNNLEDFAGQYFRDETSQIIQKLNNEDKQGLFGIERKDGVYTIIGNNSVYYSTKDGFKGEISLRFFSNILSENAIKKGKNSDFEYIETNQNIALWINNKSTMESIWNIVIWLENLIE